MEEDVTKIYEEYSEELLFCKYFNNKNFDYPEKPLKYKHIRRISD